MKCVAQNCMQWRTPWHFICWYRIDRSAAPRADNQNGPRPNFNVRANMTNSVDNWFVDWMETNIIVAMWNSTPFWEAVMVGFSDNDGWCLNIHFKVSSNILSQIHIHEQIQIGVWCILRSVNITKTRNKSEVFSLTKAFITWANIWGE